MAKGNVTKWVKAGIVKRYKDADGKLRSGVRYNVLDLESAALRDYPSDCVNRKLRDFSRSFLFIY